MKKISKFTKDLTLSEMKPDPEYTEADRIEARKAFVLNRRKAKARAIAAARVKKPIKAFSEGSIRYGYYV